MHHHKGGTGCSDCCINMTRTCVCGNGTNDTPRRSAPSADSLSPHRRRNLKHQPRRWKFIFSPVGSPSHAANVNPARDEDIYRYLNFVQSPSQAEVAATMQRANDNLPTQQGKARLGHRSPKSTCSDESTQTTRHSHSGSRIGEPSYMVGCVATQRTCGTPA
ncbi:hypothetical protein M405DRAFT_244619 [Rhizopogon salebrosus TDB-379]|nr:hypothetical protein M405DRAFT_244619 [Rhizopogon salebrosus TDB-379]